MIKVVCLFMLCLAIVIMLVGALIGWWIQGTVSPFDKDEEF